jgi:hypothetical protein
MTDEQALAEALAYVPAPVHELLTLAGFVPTGDAGNLWFYNRGRLRLTAGEGDIELPRGFLQEVTVYDMEDGDYFAKFCGRLAGICSSFIADDLVDNKLGGSFHPDTPAADYIFFRTDEPLFTEEEANLYKRRVEALWLYSPCPYEAGINAINRWERKQS